MISIDWPMFAFDMRLILWPAVFCLVALWFFGALRLRRSVKHNQEFRKWVYGVYRPWYIHAQIWLSPVFHLMALFAGGKVSNWLFRLGKRKPSV